MADQVGLRMHGLRELNVLMTAAGKEAKRDLTRTLREVAEPMRASAESLAASGIRRIGPKWSRMRIGVTRNVVYIAPRQRGVKTRGPDPRRRPRFADLLEARAMGPAQKRHTPEIEQRVDAALTSLALRWNRL